MVSCMASVWLFVVPHASSWTCWLGWAADRLPGTRLCALHNAGYGKGKTVSGELLRAYLVAQKCPRAHADVLRAAPSHVIKELHQRLGRLASPAWQGKAGPTPEDERRAAGSRRWERVVQSLGG